VIVQVLEPEALGGPLLKVLLFPGVYSFHCKIKYFFGDFLLDYTIFILYLFYLIKLINILQ
jgi:hypothetical protein